MFCVSFLYTHLEPNIIQVLCLCMALAIHSIAKQGSTLEQPYEIFFFWSWNKVLRNCCLSAFNMCSNDEQIRKFEKSSKYSVKKIQALSCSSGTTWEDERAQSRWVCVPFQVVPLRLWRVLHLCLRAEKTQSSIIRSFTLPSECYPWSGERTWNLELSWDFVLSVVVLISSWLHMKKCPSKALWALQNQLWTLLWPFLYSTTWGAT